MDHVFNMLEQYASNLEQEVEERTRELVAEKIASIKENITVRRFTRYKMGEGIAKRQDDFAAEVASMVG